MTAVQTEPTPAAAPLSPTGHIRQAVETLAACRTLATETGAKAAALLEQFKTDHAQVLGAASIAKKAMEQADVQVRALVAAHYAAIPKADTAAREAAKRPVPGIVIKVGTTLVYDAANALAWAREKQMALLPESLDVKAFEAIAAVSKLAFVLEQEAPVVTIASDLDKALAEVVS